MDILETQELIPKAKTKPRIISNTLIVFMVAMVFANIASEMYVTMLPLYLKYLGADVLQIGMFFTISQIIPLVLQVVGDGYRTPLGDSRASPLAVWLGWVPSSAPSSCRPGSGSIFLKD